MCLSISSVAGVDMAQHATTAMTEMSSHAIANAAASGTVVPATGGATSTRSRLCSLRQSAVRVRASDPSPTH